MSFSFYVTVWRASCVEEKRGKKFSSRNLPGWRQNNKKNYYCAHTTISTNMIGSESNVHCVPDLKEIYDFKEPTNLSHPICIWWVYFVSVSISFFFLSLLFSRVSLFLFLPLVLALSLFISLFPSSCHSNTRLALCVCWFYFLQHHDVPHPGAGLST